MFKIQFSLINFISLSHELISSSWRKKFQRFLIKKNKCLERKWKVSQGRGIVPPCHRTKAYHPSYSSTPNSVKQQNIKWNNTSSESITTINYYNYQNLIFRGNANTIGRTKIIFTLPSLNWYHSSTKSNFKAYCIKKSSW